MIETEDTAAADTPFQAASRGSPLLKVQNISKTYDSGLVVQDLNLEVLEGEFLTLFGPADCGKSTILRLIAGLEPPTVGKILLSGAEITATPAKQRPINMVFQRQVLFPHLSVEQNIAFGLKQDRLPASEIRARVEELLSSFGLAEINRRKPYQLSQRQGLQAALARSLARKPKLLLLDDPLAGFEKPEREELSAELKSIRDRADVAILMATRDRDTAMTVSDRIGVVNQGELVQIGSPEKVQGAPMTSFVARHMADMNVLHGKISSGAGGILEIKCPEIDAILHANGEMGESPGSNISIGLKPERLHIQLNEPTDKAFNALPCTITNITHSGNQRIVHVALSDSTIIRVAQTDWYDKLLQSDKVWLHWPIGAGTLMTS